MQKKLVTQTRFSYIVWHWTQWICFVLVKEWKMVNAWLRGENFPIKQRERILSAYPEFSFKSSLLWFAPRILAITCATRFMDSKNNVLMKPLSNAQQRFQAPPRAFKRRVLGLRIQPWDFLLTCAGTWYPDKTTSWSKTLVRDGLLGVILI